MTMITALALETAFVPPGTPTLADCMDQIEQAQDLDLTRQRDLLSGLRRVASALGKPPAVVPADPS
jgi:hypothetical protein